MKVILVVALCLAAAEAATCPSLSVVKDFDPAKFAGTWYNQLGLPGNFLTQGPGSCVKADYTLDASTGILTVVNTQKSIIGLKQTIEGTAVLFDPTKTEGKLNVTLKTPVGSKTAVLSVLSTDYDRYAILWSCYEVLGVVVKNSWVHTRKQVFKDEEKTTVDALITDALVTIAAENGPVFKDFRTISQNNC